MSTQRHLIDGVLVEFPTPAIPLPGRKATMRAALATHRWEVETGGIVVAGMPVPTDRETQDRVDQIVKAFADGDITGTVKFKLGPGQWVELDEAAMKAIKAAGAQHIQACFSRESDLDALIEAAAGHNELDAIDINTGWPS